MKRGLLPSSYIKLVSFGITVFDALFTVTRYWRESATAKPSPLQFYCQSLPLSCIVKERELLFWRKIMCSDNIVLAALSRGVTSTSDAIGSLFGITTLQSTSASAPTGLHLSSETLTAAKFRWGHPLRGR